MLRAITLENFKSFGKKTHLYLAPLTVLIGANASGKSNAIEAMRLLSWLAQGQRLSAIQFAIQEDDQFIRGTVEDLFYIGSNWFCLGAEVDRAAWNKLSMRISLRSDELHIDSEKLTHDGASVPLYELDRPSTERNTDCGVAYNNFTKGRIKPHIICSDQQAIFTQLTSPATFKSRHAKSRKTIPVLVRSLEKWLSEILFLDPVPARMREYAFPNERRLRGDGSNLSAVLYHLWGETTDQQSNRSQRDTLLSFIQSLPEQSITDISFLKEPRGGVMVQLTETFGGTGRKINATLLSDGTLRVLSIAAALMTAPEGSIVVIEEIDNGIHPSRAQYLLDKIRTLAEQRHLHVVLSTHNPALLDALPDAALPDVLFCYRDPQEGDSRMVRLQDIPDYPGLIGQSSLGGLVSSGILERFVKQFQTFDRKERALAWLRSTRGGM